MGHGTGRSYIIQRLRQDQHDVLLRGVLNGQITAHQAAIQAGYTKPRPIKAKHETNQHRRAKHAMMRLFAER